MKTNTRIREKIGGVTIHKGKTGESDIPLVMWDAIPACDPDTCPIEDQCAYNKNGKCTLRVNYQKHIVDTVLASIDKVNSAQMLMIGMHLMPLYTQLVQMKIVALNAEPMVVSRGSIVPNPVFKEIRTIIRDISACLRDIGIQCDPRLSSGDVPTKPDGRGAKGYYEKLMELEK